MANDFQGKKVTVMGLGLYKEGSGIEAVKFFLRQGAAVTVTDLRSAKELEASVRELVRYYSKMPKVKRAPSPGLRPPSPRGRGEGEGTKKLTFILGKHREEDFKNVDLVFQNPSVPADSPYLRIAQKRKIPILNDWSLFLSRHTPKLFIGVTGTRGKSTTTAMVHEMMKRQHKKVWLAGNLGVSPLAFIDTYRGEPIVAELSSWLLHHFPAVKKSPNIAVVTNIMSDHMDKYSSMREYIADKENILKFQKRGDVAVLNSDDPMVRKMARKARGRVVWFRSGVRCPSGPEALKGRRQVSGVRLLGEHNVANINAAVAVAKILGVPHTHIEHALKTFHGLPGRLELVRTVDGVRYYNDTTATTPDATIAALKTLGHPHPNPSPLGRGKGEGQKRIVLIAGGADKKLEYRELAKYVAKYCKAVVLLPGTATNKLKLEIRNLKLEIWAAKNMKEAVRKASTIARDGDMVLLSPAAASFGLFRNEFDRGKQFVAQVRKL